MCILANPRIRDGPGLGMEPQTGETDQAKPDPVAAFSEGVSEVTKRASREVKVSHKRHAPPARCRFWGMAISGHGRFGAWFCYGTVKCA